MSNTSTSSLSDCIPLSFVLEVPIAVAALRRMSRHPVRRLGFRMAEALAELGIDVLEGRNPSWLHPSMVYEPADPTRLLINVPPEHAKSTTITVNYSTYKVCMDPDNTRIIVISKTLTKAQEFVYSIKQRLTHPMWAKLQATYAPPGGWREDAEKHGSGANP